MKFVLRTVGFLLLVVLLLGGSLQLASETGEVVTLTSQDDTGAPVTTRLWVVDLEGFQYLRSGDPAAGWYQRLVANPNVTVERNGQTASYTAVPDPSKVEAVNRLMADKYGLSESYISSILGGRDTSVAVRLEPTE